jgi:uncharacterized protein (UPF0261 family)
MDIGVLAQGALKAEIPNVAAAAATQTTLTAIAALGDKKAAMAAMAEGAIALAIKLAAEGSIDGMLAFGPKLVVSTIAYSHLIPPERISLDLLLIRWAGGLYGLNDICRSSLAQAAGAVVGAARAARRFVANRPIIGLTSLGKSCLSYMELLLPALEACGYEVAVFHTTGVGGRAFEALAASGAFAAVMNLSLQGLANHCAGSIVTAGVTRLEGAGRLGVPQLVAPGAIDMIDFPTWIQSPPRLGDCHRRRAPGSSATHRREARARAGSDCLYFAASRLIELGSRRRADACAGSFHAGC